MRAVKGLEHPGQGTFFDCKRLRRVQLGESLEVIGNDWFRGSGLEEVIVPKTVKVIENSAFYECERLKRVVFQGDGPEVIQEFAFAYSGLESFTAPASLR